MSPKKPYWDYIEDIVSEVILDIIENGLSVRKAADKWGIPRLTISNRLSG